MISIYTAIFLLLAHTVADFVFQTDEMAVNKSSSNKMLAYHVYVYSIIMFVAFAVIGIPTFFAGIAWFGITFALHFITDWITSRLTSRFYKQEKRHAFFVTIGFDQFAHAVAILLTYHFLT